jgi:hypothetical protein
VTDAGDQAQFPTITVERVRHGYVIVDRSGAVATPTPMSEAAARRFCRVLRIDWPFPGRSAGPVGDAAQAFRAVAAELAHHPHAWQCLLREHSRTDDGYCAHRQCGRPGYGTPHVPHPCPARVLATLARDLHRAGTDELSAPPRSDPHD